MNTFGARSFKQILATILLAPLALVLSSAELASADESEEQLLELYATTGIYSEYLFRGKNVYDGTSIQPSVTGLLNFGDAGALVANTWLHVSGETDEPPEKFTELDFTLSYELYVFDMLNISVGHIWYRFPGDGQRIANTEEFFVGLSLDLPGNPSFNFYNDYEIAKYQYFTLSFSEPFPVSIDDSELDIVPYVTFGFASNADDRPRLYSDDGLAHIDLGFSLNTQFGWLMVAPNFNLTLEEDDSLRNEFWFGIDLGIDI